MNSAKQKKRRTARIRNLITVLVVLLILVGVPYAILRYQAEKSGMSIKEVIQRKMVKSDGEQSESEEGAVSIQEGVIPPGSVYSRQASPSGSWFQTRGRC